MPCGLIWSGNDKANYEKFKQDYSGIWAAKNSPIDEHIIGATIGVHIGHGAVGMAFFKK